MKIVIYICLKKFFYGGSVRFFSRCMGIPEQISRCMGIPEQKYGNWADPPIYMLLKDLTLFYTISTSDDPG